MNRPALLSILACTLAWLTGCVVELRGGAAQEACSELTAAFCARLADCDGSVDADACTTADDALGGPCANASVVELDADLATCVEAVGDMECARIEERTAPGFQVDCVQDVRFDT